MECCPACRSRLGDTPLCPRCGCDFTLAIRAETRAQNLACRAIQAWRDGDHGTAALRIGESLALKHGRLAKALAIMLREPCISSDGATLGDSLRHPPVADQADHEAFDSHTCVFCGHTSSRYSGSFGG
ncbi:MAG: hypothetical protein HY936_05530 [Nitrosomonadales bacterium]|nr:hypothetical protein [Nitrosomonadales bacterium]